jgi:D-alanine-D-alanine ligase
MRIAFLYNRAAEDPAGIAEDHDPPRSPVVAALRSLGNDVEPIACTLDFARVRASIERAEPDVAFNRVESLGGSDALAAAIPLLLDSMQIPYTGCSTEAIVRTADKVRAKEQLVAAGLPTPEWADRYCGFRISDCGFQTASSNPQSAIRNPKFILKSIQEHASFAMDDSAVVTPESWEDLVEIVDARSNQTGRPFFAERFIDGREFNLSLMGERPEVLPPAEIDFSAFPSGKPRIVGFGAKWAEKSFEFQNTPRRFNFPASDAPLLRWLTDLAVECWRLFRLTGYARVDFRVDPTGQPWILEVNTNPCLSPRSGFAAALKHAGLSYGEGIERILVAAFRSTGSFQPAPPAHVR